MERLWPKPHVATLSIMTFAAIFSLAQIAWHPVATISSPSFTPARPGQAALSRAAIAPVVNAYNQATISSDNQTAVGARQQPTTTASAAPKAPEQPAIERQTIALDRGDTLKSLLSDANVMGNQIKAAMGEISRVFDLKRLRQGQNVTLVTRHDNGEGAELLGIAFRPEATTEITLSRGQDGNFRAEAKTIPTVLRSYAASATIDSSLFGAGERAGIPLSIMKDFFKLFSYDVDFQRDIKPGDRFDILYEQTVTRDNVAVGNGEIVYAALQIGGHVRELYRYRFKDGTTDYFTDQGASIRRGLLRTPVDGARITSGFGMRMHPILGFSKMHKGVDFGAPTGSPIFAAGDGIIEEEGWKGSYGRYIRIRHNNTLGTAYAHMSGFAANLHRGSRVRQGQVIGYIGMTGRATGPHLHYEVLINGVQVNPMGVNLPTTNTLSGHDLEAFYHERGTVSGYYHRLLNSSQQQPSTHIASE